MEKRATPPAEESENNPDSNQGEEGEKIQLFTNKFSSTKFIVINLYLSNKRKISKRCVFGLENVIRLLLVPICLQINRCFHVWYALQYLIYLTLFLNYRYLNSSRMTLLFYFDSVKLQPHPKILHRRNLINPEEPQRYNL